MKLAPKVSIVLTSYNQIQQLERAFNSLINQSYKNIEIIIVDDCSTDGVSQPFIASLGERYPHIVRHYFQPHNVGIAANKNTGFKLARGTYITYLDGDDYYLPEKIEREVEAILTDPTIDVVYADFRIQGPEGKFLGTWSRGAPVWEGFVFEEVISRRFPGTMLFRCELMKAKVLQNIGYYDETITAYHDWDSRIRYAKFCKLKYIDYVGSVYVQDPAGVSKIKTQMFLLQELQQVFEKNRHLLSDLTDSSRKAIEKSLEEKWLEGLLIHSNSLPQFCKSVVAYLQMKPTKVKFVLRQVYGRVKPLLLQR